MRRMILTSLVLLPVLAQAQASTPTESQPFTSSANSVAELALPASPTAAASASINSANLAATRQIVQTRVTDSFADAALRKGGGLDYAMFGSVPSESSAPQVVRAVEIELSQQELDARPAVTNVVVRATVDAYGFPRNLGISQSAGPIVDKKALAAISQYRFKPATRDNKPVDAAVLITIKIQKP